jgi:hypothetical protein
MAINSNLFSTLFLDDTARSLIITGGDPNQPDSLTLTEPLNTALTLVDVSGFEGQFFSEGWDSLQGSNARIVGNGYDLLFDINGDNTVIPVT